VGGIFGAEQVIHFGNRCGHISDSPRLYLIPDSYKLPPNVIQYAIAKLKDFYNAPERWLKKLSLARTSSRQERSEAREADCAVAGILLQYLDLSTMRFGIFQNNGNFTSFDMRFIAKKLGWRNDADEAEDREALRRGEEPRHRGLKRVQRALERLNKAGYITTHTRCKVVRGEGGEAKHLGLAAVRCLSVQFFYDLGIRPEELKKKRDEAVKRLKARLKKEAEAKIADERKAYDAIVRKLNLERKQRNKIHNTARPFSAMLGLQEKSKTIAEQSLESIRAMLNRSPQKQPDG